MKYDTEVSGLTQMCIRPWLQAHDWIVNRLPITAQRSIPQERTLNWIPACEAVHTERQ